jgi:hypothetical protein
MAVQEAIKDSVLQDLRSGMSDLDIMQNYGLSYNDLRNLYKILFEDGLLNQVEESEQAEPIQKELKEETTPQTSNPIQIDRRDSDRYQIYSEIPVRDVDQPNNQGVVYDVNETGMRLVGVEAEIDETKKLVVCDDVFGEVAPFELEARCRWVERNNGSADAITGFEITKISNEDLERLRELIQAETV